MYCLNIVCISVEFTIVIFYRLLRSIYTIMCKDKTISNECTEVQNLRHMHYNFTLKCKPSTRLVLIIIYQIYTFYVHYPKEGTEPWGCGCIWWAAAAGLMCIRVVVISRHVLSWCYYLSAGLLRQLYYTNRDCTNRIKGQGNRFSCFANMQPVFEDCC